MLKLVVQAAVLCAAASVAVASSIDDPYSLVEAASERAQGGDLPGALSLFHRAASPALLSQMPQQHQAQVLHNLGFTLHRLGRLGDALDAYTKAIARAPMPDTHVKAAFCANAIGQTGLSAGHLVAAIKMSKGNAPPTLYLHLGDAYNNLKRHGDAVKAYKDGLARVARAAGNSKAAIKRDPTLADLAGRLYQGVGDVLVNSGNYTDALRSLSDAEVYYEAASAAAASAQRKGSKRGGVASAAATGAGAALSVNLDLAAGKLECLRSLGLWDGYDALVHRTERALAAKLVRASANSGRRRDAAGAAAADEDEGPSFAPYAALFLDLNLDPLLRRNLSAAWTAPHLAPPSHAPASSAAKASDSSAAAFAASTADPAAARALPAPPLRLGLMSRRFHHYPGTHLMLGLFARFDRSRVSVHCFATGPDGGAPKAALAAQVAAGSSSSSRDASASESASASVPPQRLPSAERSRLARECDTLDDASALSSPATADLIRSRHIDVLLDYDGAHDFNNLATLAHAPAGVSASWLGFAGPVGFTRNRAGGAAAAAAGAAGTAEADAAAGGAHSVEGPLDLPLPPAIGHRYSIVDAVIAPPEAAAATFAESLVYLPHTYQPQDPDQALTSVLPATDADDASVQAAAGAGHDPLRVIQVAEGLQLPSCVPAIDAGLAAAADSMADADAAADTESPACSTDSDAACGSRDMNTAAGSDCAAVRTQRPFVMASFNRLSKLDERMWSVWTNALQRCGGHCLLWLYAGGSAGPHRWPGDAATAAAAATANHTITAAVSPSGSSSKSSAAVDPSIAAAMSNLWAQAAAHGVHPSRIVFAGKAPRAAHLRRLQAADLQLDSRVYGAHTTAADGLFTGVPLVTAPGQSMVSRVGLSLLRSASIASVSCNHTCGTRVVGTPFGNANASAGFVLEALGAAASLAGMEDRAVALAAPPHTAASDVAGIPASHAAVDDTSVLSGNLPAESAAAALKRAIAGVVANTRAANSLRHGATPTDGGMQAGDSGVGATYRGLFDAAGFASALARAGRAMHEARVLTGPHTRLLTGAAANAASFDDELAMPRLSRDAPHVVLLPQL